VGMPDLELVLDGLRGGGNADETFAYRPSPSTTPGLSRRLRPRLADNFPEEVSRELALAFPLAIRRIGDVPACSALFGRLGSDGAAALTATEYEGAFWHSPLSACKEGIAAYTSLGGRKTHLCPSFGLLPTEKAAAILIHEALHLAGLGENPPNRAAMTSIEITRLVAQSCSL
jgi:hypothetical protein